MLCITTGVDLYQILYHARNPLLLPTLPSQQTMTTIISSRTSRSTNFQASFYIPRRSSSCTRIQPRFPALRPRHTLPKMTALSSICRYACACCCAIQFLYSDWHYPDRPYFIPWSCRMQRFIPCFKNFIIMIGQTTSKSCFAFHSTTAKYSRKYCTFQPAQSQSQVFVRFTASPYICCRYYKSQVLDIRLRLSYSVSA